MIKLLIVDDSAFMRMTLRKMLKSAPDIEVVGEARNGLEAVQMVEKLQPDVITMDIEMPEMDGLEATAQIMKHWPRPIIMLSHLTQNETATTIKALELGAVDFISKKSSLLQLDIVQIGQELVEKIQFWAKQRNRSAQPVKLLQDKVSETKIKPDLIVLGASTGGPAAISQLLKGMKPLDCPMVIAQHMPPSFTKSFADHLRHETGLDVVEGSYGLALKPGLIVVAPGGTDTWVRESSPKKLTLAMQLKEEMIVHPSVDVLFLSLIDLSIHPIAIVLTGMGSDGAQGALALNKAKNCPVWVQEPSTCVIEGMPSSVIAAGGASEVLDLNRIARRLTQRAGFNPA